MNIDPPWQFWMNWGVQALSAVATLLAVVVALFGEVFRAKFFPPVLALALVDESGEKSTLRKTF